MYIETEVVLVQRAVALLEVAFAVLTLLLAWGLSLALVAFLGILSRLFVLVY